MKISVTKKIASTASFTAPHRVATSLVATSLVAMATRVVVVTGANRGIGFAIARNILRNISGAHVWLGSRSKTRGEAAVKALISENPSWTGRVAPLELDVSDSKSVSSAAATVSADLTGGRALSAIINNAGYFDTDSNSNATTVRTTNDINWKGTIRMFEAFSPLFPSESGGRVVNVSSASGPMFLAKCSEDVKKLLKYEVPEDDFEAEMAKFWKTVDSILDSKGGVKELAAAGLANEEQWNGFGPWAYGFSKALVNCYTARLSAQNPSLIINACTPGFIQTDMTAPFLSGGKTAKDMGMKSPDEGAKTPVYLAFGELPKGARGWFFGSDAKRSPLDRYRAPGDPVYEEGKPLETESIGSTKLPSLKLTYFPFQGAAEKVRLAFVLGKIPFEDNRIAFKDWPALKPKTPYGQIPLLEINGSKPMAQSEAMLRYAGRLSTEKGRFCAYKLYPRDLNRELEIEEALGLVSDIYRDFRPAVGMALVDPAVHGHDSAIKGTTEQKIAVRRAREAFMTGPFVRHMKVLSKRLAAGGDEKAMYICGGTDGPTIADCALVPLLARFKSGGVDHVPATCLDAYPVVLNYFDRFMALPEVKAWYAPKN